MLWPVEKGQKLGEFKVTVEGEEIYKNNIVSPDFYKKAGYNCNDKTAFIQWLK